MLGFLLQKLSHKWGSFIYKRNHDTTISVIKKDNSPERKKYFKNSASKVKIYCKAMTGPCKLKKFHKTTTTFAFFSFGTCFTILHCTHLLTWQKPHVL